MSNKTEYEYLRHQLHGMMSALSCGKELNVEHTLEVLRRTTKYMRCIRSHTVKRRPVPVTLPKVSNL
jgi:hypothetical protein